MDLTKTNFNTLLLEITKYNHLIYYCFYILTKLQVMGVQTELGMLRECWHAMHNRTPFCNHARNLAQNQYC